MRHLSNITRSSALWGKAGGGRVFALMLLVTVALAVCSVAAFVPAASWND